VVLKKFTDAGKEAWTGISVTQDISRKAYKCPYAYGYESRAFFHG